MFGSQLALGSHLFAQITDQALVFGMNIGERTVFTGLGHDLEVVGRQLVKAGHTDHEQLEAGMTLSNRVSHFINNLWGRLQDDGVDAVVDNGFVPGFRFPGFDAALNRLAGFGQGIIDDGGHTATRRSHAPGVKIINRAVAHKFDIHMGVDINATGEEVFSGRVNFLCCRS